jgi:hypothetical protein
VATCNGKLAVALEANESSRFWHSKLYTVIKEIIVGSFTYGYFSPDGNISCQRNEGEPSDDYSNDPNGVYLLLRWIITIVLLH